MKKGLLKKRNKLNKDLDIIREKKRSLHEELMALKKDWKDTLKNSNAVQDEIDNLSMYIKKKRVEGKRGFRMSGLSINIREKLDTKIIEFFNLENETDISRIKVMKCIFNYIREHDLYKKGDKRFITLDYKNNKVVDLIKLFNLKEDGCKFRIQRFRSYLETYIKILKKTVYHNKKMHNFNYNLYHATRYHQSKEGLREIMFIQLFVLSMITTIFLVFLLRAFKIKTVKTLTIVRGLPGSGKSSWTTGCVKNTDKAISIDMDKLITAGGLSMREAHMKVLTILIHLIDEAKYDNIFIDGIFSRKWEYIFLNSWLLQVNIILNLFK